MFHLFFERSARFAVPIFCAACCVSIGRPASAQNGGLPPVDVEFSDGADAPDVAAGAARAIALPPGLTDEFASTAGEGVDVERLNRSAEEALADIEPAAFEADEQADPVAALSPLAQRSLDRALALMRDGRSFDAIESLLEAERLAPGHPLVARTLGLAYVRGGNHVLGAANLRRSAGLDPADTEVRVILARLALEQGAWDEALSLAASVSAADAAAPASNPAALCVADYTRAVALDEIGDALAAITLYERVLASEIEPDAQSPAGRELYIIRERTADIRQRIGDLHLRRNDPGAALTAFQSANIERASDPAALATRRVYALLLERLPNDAVEQAVAFLASPRATEFDAALIGYLIEQGIDAGALDAQLVAAQEQAPAGHFPLVAARAVVLPQAQTIGLIDAWLADQPARLDTFRRAIALLRSAGRATQDDPEALARAFALTASAMRREPRRANDYAAALLNQNIDAVALIRAMRRPEIRDTDNAMLLRLTASGYLGVGRYEDAVTAYARALTHEPDDAPTQLAFARLLIALGTQEDDKFAQAATLLGEVGYDDAWDRFAAYIDYLRLSADPGELPAQANAVDRRTHERESRRHAINLNTAQQMIAKRLERHPNDLDLLLLQVQVMTEANYLPQAIRQLEGLLTRFPTREIVYSAALSLHRYIQPGRNRARDLDAFITFYNRTILPRLSQYLPDSRTARLMEINSLLDRVNRPERALPIIEAMLEANPDDATALDALIDAYTALGDTARADAAKRRWIALLPQGLSKVYEQIDYAIEHDDMEQVAALVYETFALDAEGVLPGMPMTGGIATSLLFDLSQAVGREQAEPAYLVQLARFPDDASLNNSLGYQWAVADKELLAAELMIQRALDAEPEVSSYLDSMGWVLYKLGRFEEAQRYMTEAIARQQIEHRAYELPEGAPDPRGGSRAVLLDHMGDILYARGNVGAAQRHWTTARDLRIAPESMDADPETATVAQRCRAKVAALEAGEQPPVARVPGEAAHGSGVHPADRE
ncbi:hypothetical protein OT109_03385 [Phycisphaeraceae bacterium D3-23]